MRFDPNKLRLWLPVLTGTFAAVFLVCCDQLSGKIHPAATTKTVVQAPVPATAVPAPAPLTASQGVSTSAPVAELHASISSPASHSIHRKVRRTRIAPGPIDSQEFSEAATKDSALPLAIISTSQPAPAALAASDSLAATSAVVADTKAEIDSAAIPTAATEVKDSTFAAPAQAPASEKPASPTAQETPSQPTDPGRTSMLLPEEIRPQ